MTVDDELLKKWRLLLGGSAQQSAGINLSDRESRLDQALEAVYGADGSSRKGGLGASAPKVSKWLADIREFFPQTVVQVIQKDAIERLNLTSLLTEKEMMESVVPDINMVATLLSLSRTIPDKNKDAARALVRKLTDELTRRLETPCRQAITGALNRSSRILNPRFKEIDWHTTIRRNLKNYQPDYKTVIPEIRVGFGRKRKSLKEVILCVDQSGSMGTSVIYSGIFGSVLASMPALSAKVIVFDTSVVDLTDQTEDPVDLLFSVQLGGGTDIAKALTYCQDLIKRPSDTIVVLITDLYEGGNEQDMKKRMIDIIASGAQLIVLTALNDTGAPFYDKNNAKFVASIGAPCFACTPDHFPELMAAAINRQDLNSWVSANITQDNIKNMQ